MISKLYKWLAILGGLATTILAFVAQSRQLKNTKQKLESEEAESEALQRQSEASQVRQRESQNAVNEALDTDFSSDDINSLFK